MPVHTCVAVVPEMGVGGGGIYASREEEGREVERGTLVCAFYFLV